MRRLLAPRSAVERTHLSVGATERDGVRVLVRQQGLNHPAQRSRADRVIPPRVTLGQSPASAACTLRNSWRPIRLATISLGRHPRPSFVHQHTYTMSATPTMAPGAHPPGRRFQRDQRWTRWPFAQPNSYPVSGDIRKNGVVRPCDSLRWGTEIWI